MPTFSAVSRDADSRFEVEPSRPRQTARPATPFRDVLAGSVGLLLSGAEVATQVVGGPVLAAAVHEARVGATAALAPGPIVPKAIPLGGPPAGGAPGPGPATLSPPGAGPESTVATMLQQGQLSNSQLLGLQQQIQQENQRFTTLSNVMRAKHDTAKAAVSNIRA
jgi:hypothetical protein